MSHKRLYEVDAGKNRVRYAIATILRDRLLNEGAFKICFEMEDEDAVIRTILRRGLKNPRLRVALERSHLVDITHWLGRYPDLAEAYCATSDSHGSKAMQPAKTNKKAKTLVAEY